MEHLLKGQLFFWLKEGAREMSDEQIEEMVQDFVNDVVKWDERVGDYREVTRGLESLRIRLQVWEEVYRTGDGTGKKGYSESMPACPKRTGGARDSVGARTTGETGMVCREFG